MYSPGFHILWDATMTILQQETEEYQFNQLACGVGVTALAFQAGRRVQVKSLVGPVLKVLR
jgi:hypothetical protein